MKKYLVLMLGLFLSLDALSAPVTTDAIYSDGLTIYNGNKTLHLPSTNGNENILTDSSPVAKRLRVIYDVPAMGGATNTAYPINVSSIPLKSIVTRVWYDVITAPTLLAGSPTIAFKFQNAADVLAATAYNNAIFNAGQHVGIEDGTASNAIKIADHSNASIKIASGSLSAGRLVFFIDYLESY